MNICKYIVLYNKCTMIYCDTVHLGQYLRYSMSQINDKQYIFLVYSITFQRARFLLYEKIAKIGKNASNPPFF